MLERFRLSGEATNQDDHASDGSSKKYEVHAIARPKLEDCEPTTQICAFFSLREEFGLTARIGGLQDLVTDGVNGILFKPDVAKS
jgi:hypothetical protein